MFSQLFGTDTTKFSGTRETCPGRNSIGFGARTIPDPPAGRINGESAFAKLVISIESALKLY
jgi:hypothetical protein